MRATDKILEFFLALEAVRNMCQLEVDPSEVEWLIYRGHGERRVSYGAGEWELTGVTPTGMLFTVCCEHPWHGRRDTVLVVAVLPVLQLGEHRGCQR
jgi:hypothetical protein